MGFGITPLQGLSAAPAWPLSMPAHGRRARKSSGGGKDVSFGSETLELDCLRRPDKTLLRRPNMSHESQSPVSRILAINLSTAADDVEQLQLGPSLFYVLEEDLQCVSYKRFTRFKNSGPV
jgi:hypothetical protein